MCSRFDIGCPPAELARRFALSGVPNEHGPPVVRPTDPALVITADRQAHLQRFGVPAPWDANKRLINARAESVAAKPTFRPLLANRCLVPAEVFVEWRHDGERRIPTRIGRNDGRMLAMAALTDGANFVIITCPAAPCIAHIHDRMPVILWEEAEAAWLDPTRPFSSLTALLTPPPRGLLAWQEEGAPPPRQFRLFG